MSIKRINEFPDASGVNLTPDDIFLFMDDPSGSATTKKVSLGTLSSVLVTGGGLSDSDRYIICKTGDDIATKYAAAKALTPGGSPLSSTNRAYLIVMPGVYPLSAQWEIDTQYVDIIGLGSSRLDRGCNVAVMVTGYDINVSANDVRIKGIGTPSDRAFKIDGDKPLQVFEECIGGYWFDGENFSNYASFGGFGTASGSFTNCSGGNYSFGGFGTGDVSFGGFGTASGSFTNCSGGDVSFGGDGGTASGTFKDCTGGNSSFAGSGGTASGSFIDCTGGNSSFAGSGGISSGTFTNCVGGDYSFSTEGEASGEFTNCTGGFGAFGSYGNASGSFSNCSGGGSSFGGFGTASGTFLRCTLTTGTFQTLSGTGKYRLCIDGNYDVINADAPPTP